MVYLLTYSSNYKRYYIFITLTVLNKLHKLHNLKNRKMKIISYVLEYKIIVWVFLNWLKEYNWFIVPLLALQAIGFIYFYRYLSLFPAQYIGELFPELRNRAYRNFRSVGTIDLIRFTRTYQHKDKWRNATEHQILYHWMERCLAIYW